MVCWFLVRYDNVLPFLMLVLRFLSLKPKEIENYMKCLLLSDMFYTV